MTGNSHIDEKLPISKIHKLFLSINKKKKTQVLNWAKNINELFIEEMSINI